jgi:hypothetical protein
MIASLLVAFACGETHPVVLVTPAGARQPRVAIARSTPEDRDGFGIEEKELADSIYVVFGTNDSVDVSISRDGGVTFGGSRTVGRIGSVALGMRRGPRIVAAGETIVITAIAAGGDRAGDVVSWHSKDQGATWTYDGRVNEAAGAAREGLHALAVGPRDEVFCVWIDLEKGTPRICGSRSSSERVGQWSKTAVIFADSEGICPCCHPSAAFDAKGRLYVMWRGHDGESRDMVVAMSNDRGETFTEPTKLGTGTWKLEACPMDGGSIDSGGGTLRSVWRRESSIFRAELSAQERKLGDGEQPSIVFGKNGEYVAWLERRGGPLLLLSPSAKDPIRLDEHASDPDLAAGPHSESPVFATWESGTSDAPKIVVARLDGVTVPAGK